MPAAAPRFDTAVVLDKQRVFVSWFTLRQDDFGALILGGYRVYFRSYRSYQTRNVTVPPDQLQVELTDLDPSTWYRIWIVAFTTMGEGPRAYRYWIKTCKWNTTFFLNMLLTFGVIPRGFRRKYPAVLIIFEDHDPFVLLLKYIFCALRVWTVNF